MLDLASLLTQSLDTTFLDIMERKKFQLPNLSILSTNKALAWSSVILVLLLPVAIWLRKLSLLPSKPLLQLFGISLNLVRITKLLITCLGYDLVMDFGFCTLKIINKSLSYTYKQSFIAQLNDTSFEHKVIWRVLFLIIKDKKGWNSHW